MRRCDPAGTPAYSDVASLFLRSIAVVESGRVRVHFAWFDLTLKVTESSSVAVGGSLDVGSVILANLSPAWSDFETQLDFGIEAAFD